MPRGPPYPTLKALASHLVKVLRSCCRPPCPKHPLDQEVLEKWQLQGKSQGCKVMRCVCVSIVNAVLCDKATFNAIQQSCKVELV